MTSYPLSDKAKGKQRAVEHLNSANGASSSSQPILAPAEQPSRDLVVRFTEGLPDLTVTVEKQDTVKDIKHRVCSLLDMVRRKALHIQSSLYLWD